jgi:hypothetical protein
LFPYISFFPDLRFHQLLMNTFDEMFFMNQENLNIWKVIQFSSHAKHLKFVHSPHEFPPVLCWEQADTSWWWIHLNILQKMFSLNIDLSRKNLYDWCGKFSVRKNFSYVLPMKINSSNIHLNCVLYAKLVISNLQTIKTLIEFPSNEGKTSNRKFSIFPFNISQFSGFLPI